MTLYQTLLPNEAATTRLAGLVAACAQPGWLVFLEGDLAAGKTFFARAFLQALGHVGPVKSPTFTVVETYQTGLGPIHHLDLYRLNDPEELHYLGFDDMLAARAICLIEWPSRALTGLPSPDTVVSLEYFDVNVRKCEIRTNSPTLQKALEALPEIRAFSSS